MAKKVSTQKVAEVKSIEILREVCIPDSNGKGLQPKRGHYLSGTKITMTQYLPDNVLLQNLPNVVPGQKLPENFTYEVIVVATPK